MIKIMEISSKLITLYSYMESFVFGNKIFQSSEFLIECSDNSNLSFIYEPVLEYIDIHLQLQLMTKWKKK